MTTAARAADRGPAPDLSLVVPCYNEARHLRASVRSVVEVLEQTGGTWDIVFVDDSRTSVGRDDVLAALRALRIGAGVHYRAVHLHPWYRRHHGERTGTLPGAEWVSARTFSLPLSAGMSDGDVADVVRALRLIFS